MKSNHLLIGQKKGENKVAFTRNRLHQMQVELILSFFLFLLFVHKGKPEIEKRHVHEMLFQGQGFFICTWR